MSVAIYIAIAFATASLVLSIVAMIIFINDPFNLNKRLDSLERKFARTEGMAEGQKEARKDAEGK